MCFFNQILNQNKTEALPTPVTKIAEKYRYVTDISCKVYSVNKKTSFSHTNSFSHDNNSYCNDCPYRYETIDIYEMLRFCRLHMRPCILGFKNQFYHWIALKETSDSDYLFVCGPVITEEKHIDVFCRALMPIDKNSLDSSKTIQRLPYVNNKILPAYAQLLFNLITIHMGDSQDKMKENIPYISMEILSNNRANKINTEKNPQYLFEMGENGLIEYIKKNIQEILKHALTGDQVSAKVCWESIIQEISWIPDIQYAIAYAIGAFSLYGQAIHDSSNFSYTPAMFSLYIDFLKIINTKKSIDEIITTTHRYFIALWTEMFSDTAQYGSEDTTKRVVNYIMANYQNSNLSIEHVSDALNINRSYMCCTFKKSITLTVKNYLTLYRLSIATGMLLEADNSISDIAKQTGFSNAQSFRKAFRKYYKITPSQYKRLGKPS